MWGETRQFYLRERSRFAPKLLGNMCMLEQFRSNLHPVDA